MITLWTDGSAEPNPGPGGWAVIDEAGKPVALGREDNTTNIRMEAEAIFAAMEYAEKVRQPLEIRTDSEFWVNVLTKWAPAWEKNYWRKSDRKPVKNLELVQKLYNKYDPRCVELTWVRGHVGTENNERADEWAGKARQGMTMEDVK